MAIRGYSKLRGALRKLQRRPAHVALLGAGMAAAADVLADGIEKEIPAKYAEGREGIGASVARDDNGLPQAKAGVGVGIRRKKYRPVSRPRRGGVGLHDWNLHWFVKGTGRRRTRRGYNRGEMPPVLKHIVAHGTRKSKADALDALSDRMSEAIEREELV